ncbi:hypothetical protein GCM10027026_31700 [Myroides odoratimimus subsp. xuanwuensis]
MEPESFDNLHARALTLTGRYVGMTELLDWVICRVLHSKSPELGRALTKRKLRRVQDEERMHYFVAAAADVGYSGDLSNALRIYERLKQARNLVAHSGNITAVRQRGLTPHVAFVLYQGTKRDLLPDPFLPSTFERLSNDCSWLSEHGVRVLHESGLAEVADLGGTPLEPGRPGPLPDDGEPLA